MMDGSIRGRLESLREDAREECCLVGRLRPEEISSILKGAITDYENRVRTEEVGQVLEVGDGIARVHGLTNVMYQEMVEFEDATGEKITGLALNLEEDNVGVIVAGDDTHIQEGNTVRRTERLASVPVGEGVLGRVIDALGRPMDGKGEIEAEETLPGDSGAGHHQAPAGQTAAPDGDQGHRLHDPHRTRAARTRHRRQEDGQDLDPARHHHQPGRPGREVRLRRHRPEGLHRGGRRRRSRRPARWNTRPS